MKTTEKIKKLAKTMEIAVLKMEKTGDSEQISLFCKKYGIALNKADDKKLFATFKVDNLFFNISYKQLDQLSFE